MKVELAYFKPNGTYYSSGSFETEFTDLCNIWYSIKKKILNKELPELVKGHSDYVVLVNVPEHRDNHPIILNTKSCVPYYIQEVLERLPL